MLTVIPASATGHLKGKGKEIKVFSNTQVLSGLNYGIEMLVCGDKLLFEI